MALARVSRTAAWLAVVSFAASALNAPTACGSPLNAVPSEHQGLDGGLASVLHRPAAYFDAEKAGRTQETGRAQQLHTSAASEPYGFRDDMEKNTTQTKPVKAFIFSNETASASVSAGDDRMLELKATAVVLIACSSLLGVIPPIYGWNTLMGGVANDTPSPHFFRLRGFTAGIMVSLALVHIIAEAFEILDGVAGDYPVAAIFVMCGIFIMILVERLSMDVLSAKTADAEAQLHTIVCCHSPAHNHAHRPNHTCTHHTHKNAGTHELEEHLVPRRQSSICSTATPTHQHAHAHGPPRLDLSASQQMRPPASHEPARTGSTEREAKKPIVMVSMLELGIVVHSVVIGMDLGVMTNNNSAMVGLIIALAFHQLFEGLGLGACVAAVRMHLSRTKTAVIVSLFVCTFPLGVAAGTALTFLKDFDDKAPLKIWLQGSFDAVSGGILLYVALVHFIAEDFSRTDVNKRENFWLRWQMIFLVVLGATTMALLALWV